MNTNLGNIKIIWKLYYLQNKIDEYKRVCELFIKWIISCEMRGFTFSSLFTAPVLVSCLPGARLLEASFTYFSSASVACYYFGFYIHNLRAPLLYLYGFSMLLSLHSRSCISEHSGVFLKSRNKLSRSS